MDEERRSSKKRLISFAIFMKKKKRILKSGTYFYKFFYFNHNFFYNHLYKHISCLFGCSMLIYRMWFDRDTDRGGGRWVGKEDFNHYHQHRSQRLDHSFHCISLRHLTLPLLYTGSHIFSLLLIYFIIPLLLFLNDLCCSDTHRESVCVFAFICVVKRFLTRSGHNDSKSIILFTFPFYLQHLCVYFFFRSWISNGVCVWILFTR